MSNLGTGLYWKEAFIGCLTVFTLMHHYIVVLEIYNCHLMFQNFVSDYSAIITDPTAFNNHEKKCQINSVVCEHFLRQGMLEIAEDLIHVSTGTI